jgi:3-oxoadipate enol-lactonase
LRGHTLLTHYVLQRPHHQVHYWLGGRTDRPLVICTHGACIDHHMFDPQLQAFAASFRVLVWDMPGHGRTRNGKQPFSIRVAAQDLLALIEAAGYEAAILVNISLGGNVAQEAMRLSPQKIRASVMVGVISEQLGNRRYDYFRMWWFDNIIRYSLFVPLKWFLAFFSSQHWYTRRFIYRSFRMPRDEFAAVWRIFITRFHLRHDLPKEATAHPLLLMHGVFDMSGNYRWQMPRWVQCDPLAHYVVIPHAGHVANWDNASFFNAAVLVFLWRYFPLSAGTAQHHETVESL